MHASHIGDTSSRGPSATLAVLLNFTAPVTYHKKIVVLVFAKSSLCGLAGVQRVLGVGLPTTAAAIPTAESKLEVRLDTHSWIYAEALADVS